MIAEVAADEDIVRGLIHPFTKRRPAPPSVGRGCPSLLSPAEEDYVVTLHHPPGETRPAIHTLVDRKLAVLPTTADGAAIRIGREALRRQLLPEARSPSSGPRPRRNPPTGICSASA